MLWHPEGQSRVLQGNARQDYICGSFPDTRSRITVIVELCAGTYVECYKQQAGGCGGATPGKGIDNNS